MSISSYQIGFKILFKQNAEETADTRLTQLTHWQVSSSDVTDGLLASNTGQWVLCAGQSLSQTDVLSLKAVVKTWAYNWDLRIGECVNVLM